MTGVPRHLRNSRRWYDADGIEQPPATVANSKRHGARGIPIHCECGRTGAMSFDGLPDHLPVSDVALRLVCSTCGRVRPLTGVLGDRLNHTRGVDGSNRATQGLNERLRTRLGGVVQI